MTRCLKAMAPTQGPVGLHGRHTAPTCQAVRRDLLSGERENASRGRHPAVKKHPVDCARCVRQPHAHARLRGTWSRRSGPLDREELRDHATQERFVHTTPGVWATSSCGTKIRDHASRRRERVRERRIMLRTSLPLLTEKRLRPLTTGATRRRRGHARGTCSMK